MKLWSSFHSARNSKKKSSVASLPTDHTGNTARVCNKKMIYSLFNSFLFFIMMKVKYLISSVAVFTERTSYAYKVCFRLFTVLMASRHCVCFVTITRNFTASCRQDQSCLQGVLHYISYINTC